MGQHIYCLTIQQLSGALHWSMISQILVVTTAAVIKFSVCLFVLRIIDQTRKRVHQLLWALIAFVCVVHTVQVILYIVQCRPMSALWNFGEKGECFSIHFTYLAAYIGGGKLLLCFPIPPKQTRIKLIFRIRRFNRSPLRPYPHPNNLATSNEPSHQNRPLHPHGSRNLHRSMRHRENSLLKWSLRLRLHIRHHKICDMGSRRDFRGDHGGPHTDAETSVRENKGNDE